MNWLLRMQWCEYVCVCECAPVVEWYGGYGGRFNRVVVVVGDDEYGAYYLRPNLLYEGKLVYFLLFTFSSASLEE